MSLVEAVRLAEDRDRYRQFVHTVAYARTPGTVIWHTASHLTDKPTVAAILSCQQTCKISPLNIRPLSDTVPLWSGSTFGAFVYVGNDAETLKNTITVKISVVLFGFRVIQEVGRLYLSNFDSPQNNWLIETTANAIAIVNKKVREPHCVIWKWASAT